MQEKDRLGVIEVTLLGGFSVKSQLGVFDDSDNRSLKMWSILAYLIIHRDRPVPRGELLEAFWADEKSGNPSNALKTLLFRTRGALEGVVGQDIDPFLTRRGSYQWNPQLPCRVDAEEFESQCLRAKNDALSSQEQMALYAQALPRYQGGLLPRLKKRSWADGLGGRYHQLYIEAVAHCAGLLKRASRFEEMEQLCLTCTQLDELEERGNILLVEALLCQGKNLEALEQYSRYTDLRYRCLGESPSREMEALYTEIMRMEQGLEVDLGAIQQDLRETEVRPGAFCCEYGMFREIYRLEARRVNRTGGSVFIGLITVTSSDGTPPEKKSLNYAMDKLLAAAEGTLRRGDVVARYSVAQLVFLLPGADRETSHQVLKRVAAAFQRITRRSELKLTCRAREIEPQE